MTYESYRSLTKSMAQKARYHDWPDVLELLESGLGSLPGQEFEENRFSIMHTRANLLAKCGRFEASFEILEMLVTQGMPCGFWVFERLPFGTEKRLIQLKRANDRLIAEMQQSAHMTYEVHCPLSQAPAGKLPLFIALHGDGACNLAEFRDQWTPDPFTQSGCIVLYVQSSQVRCYNGFGWLDNPEVAHRDINDAYDAVCRDYPVDRERVFIGGYSGGAITSLDVTLSRAIPVAGFIALCPEIKPGAFTEQNVVDAAKRGVRGVFWEGSLALPVVEEEEMARSFLAAGLPLLSMFNEGFGHEIPDDFSEKAVRALGFIQSGSEGMAR